MVGARHLPTLGFGISDETRGGGSGAGRPGETQPLRLAFYASVWLGFPEGGLAPGNAICGSCKRREWSYAVSPPRWGPASPFSKMEAVCA